MSASHWNNSTTCPLSCTMVITKNKTTSPPSASAIAMLRLRRARSDCLAASSSSTIDSHPASSDRRQTDQILADECGKQRKQIENRYAEESSRRRLPLFVGLLQHGPCLPDHPAAEAGSSRNRQ